jgi:hypothetical protein
MKTPLKIVLVVVLVTRPRRKAEYDEEDEDERFSFNVAPQRGMENSSEKACCSPPANY